MIDYVVSVGCAVVGLLYFTRASIPVTDEYFITWLFFMWLFSLGHRDLALESLSTAKIPISDSILGYFELSIKLLLLHLYASYWFHSTQDLRIAMEMKDDPHYRYKLKFLDVECKRLATWAVIVAVLKYLGFSFTWLPPLVSPIWPLVEVRKLNFLLSPNQLLCLRRLSFWLLLFSPHYFVPAVNFLILYFHLIVVEPCFHNLLATSPVITNLYEKRKCIEILFTLLANAAAAHFFNNQTEELMHCFLGFSFAGLYLVSWFNPSTDFGMTQFFVTASIQCAVSVFRTSNLFYTAFIIFIGFSVLVLKWIMESNPFPKRKISLESLCISPIVLSWYSLLVVCLELSRSRGMIHPIFKASENIDPFYTSGNIHPYLLFGSAVVHLYLLWWKFRSSAIKKISTSFWNWKFRSSAIKKISTSFWNWKYGRNGSSNVPATTTPFYYIHFRDVLLLFVWHIHIHGNRDFMTPATGE